MRQPPPKTLLELLDRTPPFLVYALAREPRRKKRPAYTVLVERSKLSARTFFRIASALTWEGVPVEWVDQFCAACGVNPIRRTATLDYIRHTMKYNLPFAHLTKPQYEKFMRQSEAWSKLQKERTKNANGADSV